MNKDLSQKKSNPGPLYKFRPNIGKLMKFNEWATEKEIKKIILDYMKEKCPYYQYKDEFDISG